MGISDHFFFLRISRAVEGQPIFLFTPSPASSAPVLFLYVLNVYLSIWTKFWLRRVI